MLTRLFAQVHALFEGSQSFSERRLLVRLPQKLPVEYVRGGKASKAVVADIGMGGMLMAIPEVLAVGTALEVSCPRHSSLLSVKCTVRWTRPQRTGCQWVGVKFSEGPERLTASWVKAVLVESGLTPASLRQRRKTFRVVTSLPAQVKMRNSEALTGVTVEDLGPGGATFRSTIRLPAFATVFMFIGPFEGLPQIAIKGRILAMRVDTRQRNEVHHHVGFVDLGAGEGRLIRLYLRRILRQGTQAARR